MRLRLCIDDDGGNYVLLGSIYLDLRLLLLTSQDILVHRLLLCGEVAVLTAELVVVVVVTTSSRKSTSTHFQSSSTGLSGLSTSSLTPLGRLNGSYTRWVKEVLMWLAICVALTIPYCCFAHMLSKLVR